MKRFRSPWQNFITLVAFGATILLISALFASAPRLARQNSPLVNSSLSISLSQPIAQGSGPAISLESLRVESITPFEFDCNSVAIAPDGEHFTCGNKDGLWYGSFSTGLERRIRELGYANWLSDGKSIVYFKTAPIGGSTQLIKIDIEDGKETEIGTAQSEMRIQTLAGNRVAFTQPDGIKIWSAETGQMRSVVDDAALQMQIGGYALSDSAVSIDSKFKFSPDARSIAVQSVFYENGTLLVTDLDKGRVIAVTNQIGDYYDPFIWAPDGEQLYYSILGEREVPELWVVNKDGTNARKVLQGTRRGAFTHLTWMPDGETLLFRDARVTGTAELDDIYKAVNVKDGTVKELFTNGVSIQLAANGKKLLFVRTINERQRYVAALAW